MEGNAIGNDVDVGQSGPLTYDSSLWTGRHPPVPAHRLREFEHLPLLDLEPKPLTDDDPDVFGQRSAVELLHDLALNALGVERDGKRRAVTIALYGQYGQGKSTIFRTLRKLLDNRRIGRKTITFGDFNIAEFKAEDLLFGFDRLVGQWTFAIRFLILFALPLPPLALFAYLEWHSSHSFPVITGVTSAVIGVVTLTSIVKPFVEGFLSQHGALWERISASLRLWDTVELWATGDEIFKGRPDILFVDNLDRASLEQQRAFLRTLHRLRGRKVLPTVIIVAFDGTSLSLSGASPETPSELLSKTFDTAVRLYPMTTDDIARVVVSLIQEVHNAADQEPNENGVAGELTRFFEFPSVCGDLARILFAHRRHSVRYFRQFLNQLVVSWATFTSGDAAQQENHPSDFSALMRLEGLFGLLPWIRHDPTALADMMSDDDADALIAYAASVKGLKQLPIDQVGPVKHYMASTRHMHPYLSDWREFTGRIGSRFSHAIGTHGAGHVDFGLPRCAKAVPAAASFIEKWIRIDLDLCDEPNGLEREKNYRQLLSSIEISRLRTALTTEVGSAFEEDVLSFWIGYLVHRIWHGDIEAGRIAALRNRVGVGGADWLLFGSEWCERALSYQEAVATQPAYLTDSHKSAFLQLLRPTPVSTMGLFTALVAVAAITDTNVALREGDRFKRRDVDIEARKPGPLASLFGAAINPRARYAIALEALGEIPPAPTIDRIEWKRLEQRADILGRLERAGCAGALETLRPAIEYSHAICRHSPESIARLLMVAAKAQPPFAHVPDGAWSSVLFYPFTNVFTSMRNDVDRQSLLDAVDLVDSLHFPNLLILTCYFYGRAGSDNDPNVATLAAMLAALATPSIVPTSWPYSYAELIVNLCEEIQALGRELPPEIYLYLQRYQASADDFFAQDICDRIDRMHSTRGD